MHPHLSTFRLNTLGRFNWKHLRTAYLLIFLSFITTCKKHHKTVRFSSEGEFACYVQYGDFNEGEVRDIGPCKKEQYLRELKAFDWERELLTANEKGAVSPTIAVRHNETHREMRISIAGDDIKSASYWVIYGYPDNTEVLISLDLESVFPLVRNFFDLEFDYLDDAFQN